MSKPLNTYIEKLKSERLRETAEHVVFEVTLTGGDETYDVAVLAEDAEHFENDWTASSGSARELNTIIKRHKATIVDEQE